MMDRFSISYKKTSMKGGFSLMEVLIAMFIFTVIMIATAGVFGTASGAYTRAKGIQQDLEDAQFIINSMAKTIRTSSVIACIDPTGAQVACSGTQQGIRIYDYSQGMCIQYLFSKNAEPDINELEVKSGTAPNKDACSFDSIVGTYDLTARNQISFKFVVVQSQNTDTAKSVGKVTIFAEICPNANCSAGTSDIARIQTTVSLRDYSVSGL